MNHAAARNACKMCTPLGACLAFSGIEGAVPFLHGSQGCSTYIRRYLISHFREPMDIASSNFGEHAAIFGGSQNLLTGLANVIKGYNPSMIGVATTCLSETIGDDVPGILRKFFANQKDDSVHLPVLVHASTPSYSGSHADGYISAVRGIVSAVAEGGERNPWMVNIIPGIFSPADIRHLKEIVKDFDLDWMLMPDYSERLDGPSWAEYHKIPEGGTKLADIKLMGRAAATLEFTTTADPAKTAGALLEERFHVPRFTLDMPIGVAATDKFFDRLERQSGQATPAHHALERGRLIDAYVDGHKYIFDKRAILYGEEDLVVAMAGFCAEIGIRPVLCASGGHSGRLAECIARVAPAAAKTCRVMEDVDFEDISETADSVAADLVIGNSKGFRLAKRLDVPLVRVGLPIHDRIGGARLLHIGYRGTQQIFDRIVNAILETSQNQNGIGYAYM